jgi:allantoate deiminase
MKSDFTTLAEKAVERCRKLATFSEDAGSLRRVFLSPPMRDVHREIQSWLEPLGPRARIDAVGNLRALYPAGQTNAPTLLIGSHLDTVPNAGPFDGILGVVLGVALLEALNGERFPFAIEILGFSEEEGVRFGVPFIGSRALVGRIDDALLNLQDPAGITVRRAIEQFGLDPGRMTDATLPPEAFAYLEYHIEQGPVLEQLGLPLAAVEAIAGQTRLALRFLGRANHAGTTPMDLRFDAVAAAAEWTTTVERKAKETPGLVATVGSFQARPGAGNVIAGEAHLSLDVRHASDGIRAQSTEDLILQARQVAQRRGLSLDCDRLLDQPAVALDAGLIQSIEASIRQQGGCPHRMVSGAGHDAMILAEKIPSAMIFLRTPGGVSHDPAETVAVSDVARAIGCGCELLHQLAATPIFDRRTCRA